MSMTQSFREHGFCVVYSGRNSHFVRFAEVLPSNELTEQISYIFDHVLFMDEKMVIELVELHNILLVV